MLLFNGLYFRGNWKFPLKPFMELRSDDKQYFNGVNGKQDVKFMMTHGSFKFTEIRSKNLVAVELPYEVVYKILLHRYGFIFQYVF